MSRALQDIDSREYAAAARRLEQLAQDDPSVIEDDRYVDLLSSAYLGQSGVDLLDTIGHWAEQYHGLRGDTMLDVSDDLTSAGEGASSFIGLQDFAALLERLMPVGLKSGGENFLVKAAALCNSRIANMKRLGRPSRRILVKTMLVNVWTNLVELRTGLIPAIRQLMRFQTGPAACEALSEARESIGRLTEQARLLSRAVAAFENDFPPSMGELAKLGALGSDLPWMTDLGCGSLNEDLLESVAKQFVLVSRL